MVSAKKMKMKQKKNGEFCGMLLGILRASLLVSMLSGKEVIPAGDRVI